MLVLASASPRRRELLQNAGIPFEVQAANVEEVPFAGESAQGCAERLARDKALAVSALRPRDFVLGADTVVFVEGQILGKPCDAADAARMLRLLSGKTHQVVTGVCLVGTSAAKAGSGGGDGSQRWKRYATHRLGSAKPAHQDLGAGNLTVQGMSSQRLSSENLAFQNLTTENIVMQDLRSENLEDWVCSETTLVSMTVLTEQEIQNYIATGEPMDKAGGYAIQGMASRWISRIEGDYCNVVGLPVSLVYGMLRERGVL